MSQQKGFPWVNLWMLAFSIGGIWLITNALSGTGPQAISHSPASIARCVYALLMLFIIGFVAFQRMPAPFSIEETEAPDRMLPTLWRLYALAWRNLWKQKWLIGMLSVFLSAAILSNVALGLIMHHYIPDVFRPDGGPFSIAAKPAPFGHCLAFDMPREFAGTLWRSPNWFSSDFGLDSAISTSAVFLCLFLMPAMIWLRMRLGALLGDAGYGRTARLLQGLLIPLTLLAVTSAAGTCEYYRFSIGIIRTHRCVDANMMLMSTRALWALACSLLILPFFVGGTAACMVRRSRGLVATIETFVRDAVRYLKPIACLYLLSFLLRELTQVPVYWHGTTHRWSRLPEWSDLYSAAVQPVQAMIWMTLMFAVFTIIVHRLGLLAAIRAAWRDLARHARVVIAFVCLGMTVAVPIRTSLAMVPIVFGRYSVPASAVDMAISIVNVIIAAWFSMVIWELYQRIGSRPAEVVAQAPGE